MPRPGSSFTKARLAWPKPNARKPRKYPKVREADLIWIVVAWLIQQGWSILRVNVDGPGADIVAESPDKKMLWVFEAKGSDDGGHGNDGSKFHEVIGQLYLCRMAERRSWTTPVQPFRAPTHSGAARATPNSESEP